MKGTLDGLILRESATGESDKLLSVLAFGKGRLTIRAKGAKSFKSKYSSLCQRFNYVNIEYYEKNGIYWFAGGSSNTAFFTKNFDAEDVALATYFLDVAYEITGEGVVADEILRTTLNALYAVDKAIKPREIIKGAYELFAASRSGFTPELSGCGKCGSASEQSYFADVMNGSCVCPKCLGEKSSQELAALTDKYSASNILIPVSASALAAARYVLSADPARLFAFELSEGSDLDDFARFCETYLLNHLERGFMTLDFYKKVQKPLF